jgi:ornithine carbamoyltransferase
MYSGAPAQWPARDLDAVLVRARALHRAAAAGTPQPLLRGKNLGLLCGADDSEVSMLRRAASELGARVSSVRTRLSDRSTPEEVMRTARMLGRLYDAIACEGQAPDLVRQLTEDTGIPVYDGIASPHHPTAELAQLIDGDDSDEDKRRYIVQALLLAGLLPDPG